MIRKSVIRDDVIINYEITKSKHVFFCEVGRFRKYILKRSKTLCILGFFSKFKVGPEFEVVASSSFALCALAFAVGSRLICIRRIPGIEYAIRIS